MIKNYSITTLAKIDDKLMNSHSNSWICAWMSYRCCSITSGAVHFSVFGLHRFYSFVCANNKMFKNDFVFHSQMLNDIFDCDVDTVNLTKLSLCYMSCVKQKSSPRNEHFNWLVRIKFLNLFLYSSLKKNEKFTGPNKVLLVLGRRTCAHREYWKSTELSLLIRWNGKEWYDYLKST